MTAFIGLRSDIVLRDTTHEYMNICECDTCDVVVCDMVVCDMVVCDIVVCDIVL